MSEEVDDAPHTPTSPTDRRRKRSVIFGSHPQITSIEDNAGGTKDIENGTCSVEVDGLPQAKHDSLKQTVDDIDLSDTDSLSQAEHDSSNNNVDDMDLSQKDNRGLETNNIESAESTKPEREELKDNKPVDASFHLGEQFNVTGERDITVVQSSINDIEYDETKPRRLPNPKKLHLDTQNKPSRVLQDSINYLISPDDLEGDSPGRRRRRQQNETLISVRSEPNFKQTKEPVEANRRESDTRAAVNGHIYQRSPDLSRRKLSHGSSPVRKLITKASPSSTFSPSTAHRMKRKMSSDARIRVTQDRIQVVKVPPRRKISSDARLVGHAFELEEQRNIPTIDDVRKRKVSFDTTALVNGNRMMPLNDEVYIPEVLEGPYHDQTSDFTPGDYHLPDNDSRGEKLPPKVYLTVENEDPNGSSTLLYNGKDENEEQYDENDTDSIVFDNRAYTADDEDEGSQTSSTPPPHYYDYKEQPERYQEASSRKANDHPAVISHTNITHEPTRNGKKVSSSSLPAGVGYGKHSLEDGPGPKSILKIRRDDTDSMISQESAAEKKFKVRKDSIALFTSQSGQIALQQMREEHQSQWKKFSGSRLKEMWSTRHDIFVKYKLHFLVLLLFTLTFAFVVVGLHLHSVHHKELAIAKKIFFDAKSRRLSLHDRKDVDTFTGILGKNIPSWMLPIHCYENYDDIHDKTCLKWKGHAQLDIAFYEYKNLYCYNVSWTTAQDTAPRDCFNLGAGYWYGPVNTTEHVWPISKAKFTFSVSSSKHYGSGTFSSAAEYYWISSNGWALFFDSNYPLEISWNKDIPREVCVDGIQSGDFYLLQPKPLPKFSYTVCNGVNIKETHSAMRERYFAEPHEIPDQFLLAHPHWSSSSDFRSFRLNASLVSQLAKTIDENKFTCGTIELDGKWESIFGDMTFSKTKFENITSMISEVRSYGCDLSLNIYPYFSYRSRSFEEGVKHNYFVMNVGKSVPALLKWEYGVGAMLDVTNSKARDWFASKIYDIISDYGIKTFRLSYGKSAWIPSNPQFNLDEMNPNKIKHFFTDLITSLGNAVLQSTSQSQHLTSIIGVQSAVIRTDERSCLRNIIPNIVNYGLMGYPFLISDGLFVEGTTEGSIDYLPNRDIYIRWMQLSAFLPALKYTIKPWDYDDEVVSAAKNLSIFHEKVVMDAIHSQREDIRNGVPIIRPLWWEEPQERMSFKVDDEFLLTNRYLVAPILCESTSDGDIAERDIYVPKGVWRDMISDRIILGPRKIKRYKVLQYEVPYFEKMPEYGDEEYRL